MKNIVSELRTMGTSDTVPDMEQMDALLLRAAREIELAHSLLSKWVTYMELSGVQPVSGDVRDNPVLQLLKDSREALRTVSQP